MAEEQEPKKEGRGLVLRLVFIVVPILIAAIAGVLTYMLLLAPMLAPEEEDAPEPGDYIPEAGQTVTFETRFANLIMPDPEIPASTLVYQVALECNDVETATLVNQHMPRFYDILVRAHTGLRREDLDDPTTLDSLKRQILRQCNDALERLQKGKPKPTTVVTAVFYEQWALSDQI